MLPLLRCSHCRRCQAGRTWDGPFLQVAGKGLQVLGGGVLEVILAYKCPLYSLAGDQREMLAEGKGGGWMTDRCWAGGESGSGVQEKRQMMAVLEPMTPD